MGNIFDLFAPEPPVRADRAPPVSTPSRKEQATVKEPAKDPAKVPGPPPLQALEMSVQTSDAGKEGFFRALDALDQQDLSCNMRLDQEARFIRNLVETTDASVAIFGFKDVKSGEVVGVALVVLNAFYASRDSLVRAVRGNLFSRNRYYEIDEWNANQPADQTFGLWLYPDLRFSGGWQRNSVVRVLCAKPQYLHAVMRRLAGSRTLLSTKNGQVPSAVLQVAVPLEDVRRFLEYEGFSLGLEPDVRQRAFFSSREVPVASPALASSLYPVLMAQHSMTKSSWSTGQPDAAQEALAQGIILSRRVP